MSNTKTKPILFATRDFATPQDVANATGKSSESILKLIKTGRLVAFDMSMNSTARFRISREQWEAYLESVSTAKRSASQ